MPIVSGDGFAAGIGAADGTPYARATGRSVGGDNQPFNLIRYNMGGGAVPGVIGAGGAMPTGYNWFNQQGFDSITVGLGVENGIEYFSVRLVGIPTANSARFVPNGGANPITATVPGQTWTYSGYLKLLAGSFAGMQSVNFAINGGRANQSNIVSAGRVAAFVPTTAPLDTQRFSLTTTFAELDVAIATLVVSFSLINPMITPVDVTIAIGLLQWEKGDLARAPIRTLGTTVFVPSGVGSSTFNAAARIAGVGGVRGDGTQVHQTFDAAAEIDGAGGLVARGAVVAQAGAEIDGLAGILATANARLAALIEIDGLGGLAADTSALVSASARIDGAGGVGTDGMVLAPVSARIDGAGNASAAARLIARTGAIIRGGEANRISTWPPTASAGNICVASTDVPPPRADDTQVFRHVKTPAGDSIAGIAWIFPGVGPYTPFTLRLSVWIPAGYGGSAVYLATGGAGMPYPAPNAAANLSLTDQWQSLSIEVPVPTAAFAVILQVFDTTSSPLYSSQWSAVPDTVMAAPTNFAAARIGGQGAVFADGVLLPKTVQASALIAGIGGTTNYIRNPLGEGATDGVFGSGGVMPTFWSQAQGTDLTRAMTGHGVDPVTGLPYIEVRLNGTPAGANQWVLNFEYAGALGVPIVPGETWSSSAYVWLTAGTNANVNFYIIQNYNTGSPAQVVTLFVPTATPTRVSVSATTPAGVGFIVARIQVSWFSAVPVDFTLRVASPQMERLPAPTAPIWPPAGSPGITTRALLAAPGVLVPLAARIDGVGSLGASTSGIEAGSAGIGGVGNVRASATVIAAAAAQINGIGNATAAGATRTVAAARIDGVGLIAADTLIQGQIGASARINGTGGVRLANPAQVRSVGATIQGVGAVSLADAAQVRAAAGLIGGQGSVAASATVLAAGVAAIAGQGAVRATAAVAQPAGALIAGAGSATIDAGLRMVHALARIAGSGAARVIAAVARPGAASIAGVGGVHSDADVHVAWPAEARIDGTGAPREQGPTVFAAGRARIAGSGAVAAAGEPQAPGAFRIGGVGHVGATVALSAAGAARVGGLGAVRAGVHVIAAGSVRIDGRGGLAALGEQLRPVRVGASVIGGVGQVRAKAGPFLLAARARIAGLGGVRSAGGISQPGAARIAGTGSVGAAGVKAAHQAAARIAGAGGLSARSERVVAASARIDGRGAVAALGRLVARVGAVIPGRGRVNAAAAELHQVRARIGGVGHLALDGEQTSHRHVAAVIGGAGRVQADAYVPRERVAALGVFLPPTPRGAAVPPQSGQDVTLPPTRREVVL
jgi:hypothetical protein